MHNLVYSDVFRNYINKYNIHHLRLKLYLTKYNCVFINRFNNLQTSLYSNVIEKELYVKFYNKLNPIDYCFVWPEDSSAYLLVIRAHISKSKTQEYKGICGTIIYNEYRLICELMDVVIKNSAEYSSIKYGLK